MGAVQCHARRRVAAVGERRAPAGSGLAQDAAAFTRTVTLPVTRLSRSTSQFAVSEMKTLSALARSRDSGTYSAVDNLRVESIACWGLRLTSPSRGSTDS